MQEVGRGPMWYTRRGSWRHRSRPSPQKVQRENSEEVPQSHELIAPFSRRQKTYVFRSGKQIDKVITQ